MARTVNNIWMLSREYGELAGAGGVKDVVLQLAESLVKDKGIDVKVVLPCYGFVSPEELGFTLLPDPLAKDRPLAFQIDMNYGFQERSETCRIWTCKINKVEIFLIEADRFREKFNVYTYTDTEASREDWKQAGVGHYDYFAMNVLLQKSSLELMVLLGEKPDVIHCHDGHTAIVPGLIHECPGWRSYFRDTGCLVTVHNAGMGYHQEVADLPFAHGVTGLSWGSIGDNRLGGKFDPFLVAGKYAVLNTVSENYARELQETDEDERTDWLGHTLLERGVTLEGITNGISPDLFNTRAYKRLGITASYYPAGKSLKLPGKMRCKEALFVELADKEGAVADSCYGTLEGALEDPLFTFIGRLSEQKGVDQLLQAVEQLFGRNDKAQLIILGSGNEFLEAQILSLIARPGLKGRICFIKGYNPAIANQIYAAGDFFVIPSRYEPCGLTDFIAQLFANVPVVHHVGGLVKVRDGESGIAYYGETPEGLAQAMERAIELFDDKEKLRAIQRGAIALIHEKYTWDVVKKKYMELYIRAKSMRAHELFRE